MALDDIWAQQMGNTKLLQVFHTRSYIPHPSNILNALSPPINGNSLQVLDYCNFHERQVQYTLRVTIKAMENIRDPQ